jgi:hypothetical protein
MYVCCWATVAFSLGSGSVTIQRPNNEVVRSFVGSVARLQPVSNSGVVFSLESVLGLSLGLRGLLGMIASLPGRGGGTLLFGFRTSPRKRKSIGQANPYGPSWPVIGIALLLLFQDVDTNSIC